MAGTVALTRARFRVISSTKWAVKMNKKYSIASSATVLKIVGILLRASDVIAKKTITENARESDQPKFFAKSVLSGLV